MHKPVSVAQRLRQAGSTLRAAHIAINRLADAGWAVCSLARMENPAALAHDLAAMNVQARRRMIPSEEAEDVAAIRVRHGLSQREFADVLGLDVRTLQNWEQGRNRPDPAALVLMRVFEHAPQVVEEAISEPVA